VPKRHLWLPPLVLRLARSVLVPLAHEEPMLLFTLTRGVIRMARALAFMTPEERRLVEDVVDVGDTPGVVVGAGLDPSPDGDAAAARAARDGQRRATCCRCRR
jgi:hypothetical protein